jgi:hypothetical protein
VPLVESRTTLKSSSPEKIRKPQAATKVSSTEGRAAMVDQHHVYTLIAKAILDARKDDREHQMNSEEANQIAKRVVEALAEAGFEISPASKKCRIALRGTSEAGFKV